MSICDRILTFVGINRHYPNILFAGLDNAGKTTLIYRLKSSFPQREGEEQLPYMIFNVPYYTGRVSIPIFGGRINFVDYDLGGMPNGRRKPWSEMFEQPGSVKGVVFMIDSTDRQRIQEAKIELHKLLNSTELQGVPVLILLNKVDRKDETECMSEHEVKVALELIPNDSSPSSPQLIPQCPIELFSCSVMRKQGYLEGFKWLAQFVNKR